MAGSALRRTPPSRSSKPRPLQPRLPPAKLGRPRHEQIRLGIVSALATQPTLTFGELKRILSTTDGNLSVHARKLEEAQYIACEKVFDGKLPKTEFRLTNEGRKALSRYLDHMEALIRTARGAGRAAGTDPATGSSGV